MNSEQRFEERVCPGVVTQVIPDKGVVIRTAGALVQGVWGNGRIDNGLMVSLIDKPDDILAAGRLDVSLRRSVILAGHVRDLDTLKAAAELPVRGLILSSIPSTLIEAAYKMRYPILETEGFGTMPMNSASFKLLTTNNKREATVNADHYDRYTGTRPEVIIPLPVSSEPEKPNPYQRFELGRHVRMRRGQIFFAQPNPAHVALADYERAGYEKTILTQNIDGLHQKAGSQTVLEVRGTMRTLTCVGCDRQYPTEHYIQPYLETGEIPRCLTCRQIHKPDVVLFEEQLPLRIWLEAQEACRSCDVLLVAGSSLEVVPVAGLPSQALECGARLIIINQSQTYLDGRAEIVLRRDVAIDIPQIVTQVLRD